MSIIETCPTVKIRGYWSRKFHFRGILKTSGLAVQSGLVSFLQNKANPKYHFIIVDAKPGLDNRQQRYLEEAVLYFKQAGLFNETTQGISIIVTKSDELSSDSSEWPRLATEYIKNCYSDMVNQLKQIVGPKRHGGLGINDGTIKVIPFSIGDVFLQKLCLFNPEPAERLVKILSQPLKTRA